MAKNRTAADEIDGQETEEHHAPISGESLPISPGISADVSLSGEFDGDADDPVVLAAEVERIRAVRKPFGGAHRKLYLPERKGYQRHWFNNTAGRIDEALTSGWSHIKDRAGQPLRRTVGSARNGEALIAFAMEIPKEIWYEDMAERNRAAEAQIESIRKSPFKAAPGSAKASDRGKFYSPDESKGPLEIVKG